MLAPQEVSKILEQNPVIYTRLADGGNGVSLGNHWEAMELQSPAAPAAGKHKQPSILSMA